MDELPSREAPRLQALQAAGGHIGAQGVRSLGYADSGKGLILYPDPPDRPRFKRVDHVHTHRVDRRAASLVGTPSIRTQQFLSLGPNDQRIAQAPTRTLRPLMGREWLVTASGQLPRELQN